MKVWLNGDIIEAAEARISPFDRGFLFGDGVYEGIAYFNGQPVEMAAHLSRLQASLEALRIPFDIDEIESIGRQLLEAESKNTQSNITARNAFLYLQITRGCEIPRRHAPSQNLSPTVFAQLTPLPALKDIDLEQRRLTIRPEIRWQHCDIKSLNLLGNIMSIVHAENTAADEVIFERDGMITEGAKTSVFVVRHESVITPPLDAGCGFPILPGVMRQAIIDVVKQADIAIEERAVTVEECTSADEIFIASSRRLMDAVIGVDGRAISGSQPGKLTTSIFELLKKRVAAACDINLHSS